MTNENDLSQEDMNNSLHSCQPIEKFLELKNGDNNVECTALMTDLSDGTLRTPGKDNDQEYDSSDQYYVHPSLIERWGSAMGILPSVIGQ